MATAAFAALIVLAALPARAGVCPSESAPHSAKQGKRVALVIGNEAYADLTALRNPVGDAKAIAQALRKAGFQHVTEHYNVTGAAIRAGLSAFAFEASGADWVVVYYAGHGFDVDGTSYVVPVDFPTGPLNKARANAVSVELLADIARKAHRLGLVILDTDRQSLGKDAGGEPVGPQVSGASGEAAGAEPPAATEAVGEDPCKKGLVRVASIPSLLFAYATSPGKPAQDGEGAHSPFAEALLNHIGESGLDIVQLLMKVREDVFNGTRGSQDPTVSGGLPTEPLYFIEPAQK